MAKKPKPTVIAFRPTEDDFSILEKLREKLGLGHSNIIRLALRKLWQGEQKQ